MADFRKLLGLAGAATLFTGMAFGQTTISCGATAAGPSLVPAAVTFISAEGQNELIPALTLTCANTGGAGSLNLSVYFSPSVTITSPLVVGSTTNTTMLATATGGTTVAGTITNGAATFSSLAVPAGAFTVTINNVRVNATAIPVTAGAAPTALAVTGFVSGTNVTPGSTGTNTTVAFVTNGLLPAKFFSDSGQANSGKFSTGNSVAGAGGGTASSFGVCGSINNNGGVSATPNFFVQVNEGFQTAFKAKADVASGVGLDTATSGTRVKVVVANVPTNLNLYMPISVTSNTGGLVPAILTAQISETAASSGANNQVPVTSPNQFTLPAAGGLFVNVASALSIATGGVFQVPVVNGTATAVYEVTTDNLNVNDQFLIPVYFQAGTNKIVSSATAMTVSTSLGPVTGTSQIPSYQAIASSTVTLSVATFTQCTTSLLFPFVTNMNGFETGIAIDNTTGDPFGAVSAQGGTCKLWFYNGTGSTGSNPTAGPAPNPNEGGTAPYNASESYAFTLTQALASASASNPASFSGYMIAQCQFTNAHGFAYITYNFPGTSSDTMGYLASVLGRGSSGGFETLGN